jgi:hypothetical protein
MGTAPAFPSSIGEGHNQIVNLSRQFFLNFLLTRDVISVHSLTKQVFMSSSREDSS